MSCRLVRFLVAGVLLVACARTEAPPVPQGAAATPLLGELRLGPPLVAGPLTVWPVLGPAVEVGEFRPLPEAQKAGAVIVREVGGGEVRTVEITNRDRRPVIGLAGTLVKGGKQDRQLAKDVIIPPGRTLRVPVFCVEPGRWQVRSRGKEAFEVEAAAAPPSVRYAGQYEEDQGEVWRRVGIVRRTVPDAAGARGRLAEAEASLLPATWVAKSGRPGGWAAKLLEAFRRRAPEALGIACAVGGEPVSVRVFARPELLQAHLAGILQGLALEAMLRRPASRPADPEKARARLVEWVKGLAALPAEERLGVGGSRVVLRQAKAGANAVTYVRRGERWLPLVRDWTAPPPKGQ